MSIACIGACLFVLFFVCLLLLSPDPHWLPTSSSALVVWRLNVFFSLGENIVSMR